MKTNPSETQSSDVREAATKILSIVLAYLYSGRDDRARQALRDMWPPFDQERIWNRILETRQKGILCYTRKDAVCGEDGAK